MSYRGKVITSFDEFDEMIPDDIENLSHSVSSSRDECLDYWRNDDFYNQHGDYVED